jgi:hypothetical protein
MLSLFSKSEVFTFLLNDMLAILKRKVNDEKMTKRDEIEKRFEKTEEMRNLNVKRRML